jgi:hypothetical protein
MFADTDFPPVSGGSSFLQGFISKLQGGSVDGTQLPTTFEYGEFASQPKGSTGGSRGEFDRDYIEKMGQPGTQMPDWMRRNPPTTGPQTPGQSGAQQAFGLESRYPEIAQGIPVGQDPLFPMTQEDFRETVNRRLDDARLGRPYTLSPELQQRIQSVRSRFGIGSV